MSDEQLKVTSYDSTHLEGVITSKEDGALFLSIPYDESWTATVDGAAAEIVPIDDAFMGIALTAGTHTVYMSYHPSKFSLCVMISVVSLIALIFFTILRKVFEYLKVKKLASEEDGESEDSEVSEASEDTDEESVEVKSTDTSDVEIITDPSDIEKSTGAAEEVSSEPAEEPGVSPERTEEE